MKLVRVIAFAMFFVAAPVASPAQSLDLPLLSAQCTDDYYEGADGQCDALLGGEVLSIEAILTKYGIIITGRTDDEVIAFYLDDLDDLDDMPVGSNSAPERRRTSNRRRACQRAAGFNRF